MSALNRWIAVIAATALAAAVAPASAAAHPRSTLSRWSPPGSAAVGPLATGDPRGVSRPAVPPTCRTLAAGLQTTTGSFSAADEADPPDRGRIQRALDACAGTGEAVRLAPGPGGADAFLSTPLIVHRGEVLLVAGGVTLYASRNPAAYQIAGATTCGTISGDGNGCEPFIDLAGSRSGVMGTRGRGGRRGVIDGRGEMTMLGSDESWWALAEAAKNGGNQNNPKLIESDGADDLTVFDVELANSPMYHLLIQNGHGLTVWDTIIDTPAAGARNTDGIDPLSESDVTIAHDFIQDGDDCIAIKSDPGVPANDISVLDSHCYGTHGISIGSQTGGGVANVLVRHDTVDGSDSLGNVSTDNNGLRIKSDALAGGTTQQVTYRDVCLTGVQNLLYFNPFYAPGGSIIPSFRDIVIDGVAAQDSVAGASSTFDGYDAADPLQLVLAHVALDATAQSSADAQIGLDDSDVVPAGPDVVVSPVRVPGSIPACRFPAFPAGPVS